MTFCVAFVWHLCGFHPLGATSISNCHKKRLMLYSMVAQQVSKVMLYTWSLDSIQIPMIGQKNNKCKSKVFLVGQKKI